VNAMSPDAILGVRITVDPGPRSQDDPLVGVTSRYPVWAIWVSSTGRYWASFRAEFSAADLASGCVPFLHADDPATLAGKIRDQEAIRAQQDQTARPGGHAARNEYRAGGHG